ncbi:Gar1/Naf1 RNA binding region-domain-containing protein [Lipomyces orientalis]|uniref:Gar1/Naf1 RNA binding region-domain-containing protein n=1 Tax=Lipomyces orientalis TaxID=1233043 RepID=A0ACC3TXR5_9ASCO
MDDTPLPDLSEAEAPGSVQEPATPVPGSAATTDELGDTIIVALPSSITTTDPPTAAPEAPVAGRAGTDVLNTTLAAPAASERQEGAEGDSIQVESETHSVVVPFTIEDDMPSATDVTKVAIQSAEGDETVAPAMSSFEVALMNPDVSVQYESDEEDHGQTIQEAGDDVELARVPHPFVIDEPEAESAPATTSGSAVPVGADAKSGTDEGEIEDSTSESESSSEDEDSAVPAASARPDPDDMDDEDVNTGPLRTKNEIMDAPVKPIDVDILPTERIEKLGVIERVVGKTVIVKALTSGEYQVLDQDSILVFGDRSLFGRVYETLGPVQKPIYSVKFNTDAEASNYLSRINNEVFYLPRFSTFVFTAEIKALKGSDASNWNDEEVDENEQEFSDDEAEAEFKRRQKELRKQSAQVKDAHSPSKDSEASQSPAMQRQSQHTLPPSNTEPYSFADLAGQDNDFLDQLASRIPVPPQPADLNAALVNKSEDSNEDADGDSGSEDSNDIRASDVQSQSPIAVPRGAPRAPRSYDDEPYKTLARPTSLLMTHLQKARQADEPSAMASRPGSADVLFTDRDSQSPVPSSGSRSPAMSRPGDTLTNSQKRRRRRKRKEERERHERDDKRWEVERSRERGRDRDRTNRQRNREEELRAREYLLKRDGRAGQATNSPAPTNASPYQPSGRPQLPQSVQQDVKSATFLQQFPGLSPYFGGQTPVPQQPTQSHYPYGQQNFQNIAQRLPPGAHVNPAFLAQFASGMLQQQQQQQAQQQQLPRAPQQQYQPPPPMPQQPDPQQSYLALLQQQLQQQQQQVLQQQQATQAPPPPPPPIGMQPQTQYQNQTQAQLQQQLQAILQQMQANAQRQQQVQQQSPAAAVPPQQAPVPTPPSSDDAFARAQYQLNLLGMLQGNQNQSQGPRPNGDPRDPRNR